MEAGSARKRSRGAGKGFWQDLRIGAQKMVERTSASHKRFVALVLVVAAALRIAQMQLPVTYDEAVLVTTIANTSLGNILWDYSDPVNHFLHTAAVKASIGLFGIHRWSIRLPALLAGLLAIPLFYAFVRIMFNRYIALLTISFLAASGALVEYSTLATGYAFTWLLMVCAFLVGRHFGKRDSTASALLLAVIATVGMWVVPSMFYINVTVYVWLVFYLLANYETSLTRRMVKLGSSFFLFLVLTALLYAPIVSRHGIDHLLHHPGFGPHTWISFNATQHDHTFALWDYLNSTAATWVSTLGAIGLFYAAYESVKYRTMVFALVVGAVPFSILTRYIGPPASWVYVLFILHLGSAIALFYLMKLVQAKLWTGFEKRMRTWVTGVVVMVGFGAVTVTKPPHRERFGDVVRAREWFQGILQPGDRVYAETPTDAPFAFELLNADMDRSVLTTGPQPGGKVYLLVSPADGQTTSTVLGSNNADPRLAADLVKVKDWKLLEIFAAR